MNNYLSIVSFLSLTAFADINSTVPPIRPTYQEVSLKVIAVTFNQEPYKWYKGHTATQSERDAMEETLSGIAIPEAVKYARSIPACFSAAKKAVSNWSGITSKLGIGYEDASIKANDSWNIPVNGRHYSFERYGLLAIQQCSIASGSAACAASPFMTKDLADLLDITIVGGRCVRGANFGVLQPAEPYNVIRANIDTVSTKTPRLPMTPFQMIALHKTHMAHKLVSDWRCGMAGPPPPGAVDNEHRAFENLARDITEQHFFAMKRFSGSVDPLWTKAEECKWARLQDSAHERWMQAVEAGNWRQSRLAENDHQMAHQCMNLKDGNYMVRFSCGQDNIFNCPKKFCEDVIRLL